jgi:hypothetical protein
MINPPSEWLPTPLAHFSTQQYLSGSRYLSHFVHFNTSMLFITALLSFTFRKPDFLHSFHLEVAFIDTQLASVRQLNALLFSKDPEVPCK